MFDLYIFVGLVVLGYVIGQTLERRHFASLRKREAALLGLVTTSSKRPLGELPAIREVRLVEGSAVISIDYFKMIAATLRGFVGGNVRAYETLVDRARREAILRMKESCTDATQVINLRIETSSIFKGKGDQVGSVEVLAYATAIYT